MQVLMHYITLFLFFQLFVYIFYTMHNNVKDYYGKATICECEYLL